MGYALLVHCKSLYIIILERFLNRSLPTDFADEADLYDREYEKGVENPTGIKSGSNRVLRGGDWGSTAYFARCASRNSNTPTVSSNIYGFRLARGRF